MEKKYYIELVPLSNQSKIKEIDKQVNKLTSLGVNITEPMKNEMYKNIKKFFAGKYKDGSDIPTPFIDKSELFNNQYDTKATLFTKEQAEKRKEFIEKYIKDWVVNVKMV